MVECLSDPAVQHDLWHALPAASGTSTTTDAMTVRLRIAELMLRLTETSDQAADLLLAPAMGLLPHMAWLLGVPVPADLARDPPRPPPHRDVFAALAGLTLLTEVRCPCACVTSSSSVHHASWVPWV